MSLKRWRAVPLVRWRHQPAPPAPARQADTNDIPLYPELRACPAPSAERILAGFADITRHELHRNGQLVQTFEADLSPLQQQILDLLGVPTTAYTPN